MTENASFKRRVRQRMARTGERYTTARAHLLDEHTPARPDGLLPGWTRTGGLQPDLAATANVLAHGGATGPTGAPLDEVDVLGLSGGIGFMYALFDYERHGPTLTLTTRTDSMPDASVDQVLARAGVVHRVEGTSSAARAQRLLDEALEAGRPALASVDESHLPAHAPGEEAVAGMPRVVGVIGRRGTDAYLLDDQDPDPVVVTGASLAAARAGLPRTAHRLVVVEAPVHDHDPVVAALAALRRTVVGYDEPPARPFAKNVGTRGLGTWAAAMTGGGTRSWTRLFGDEGLRSWALARTAAWIDEDLTAPGANRGLWAGWVDRVAAATGRDGLGAVAQQARASQQRWLDLAAAARAGADAPAAWPEVLGELADRVTGVATAERALLDDLEHELDAV